MIILTREQQLSTAFISLLVSITPSHSHLASDEFWLVESLIVWKPLHISAHPQLCLFFVSLFWGCGGTRRGKDRQGRAAFCKISIQWYCECWLIPFIIFVFFPVIGRSVTTSLTVPVMIKKKIWLSEKKPFQNPNPKSTTHGNLLLWLLRKHLFKAEQTFPTKLLTKHTFSWKEKKRKEKKTQQQCLELIQ